MIVLGPLKPIGRHAPTPLECLEQLEAIQSDHSILRSTPEAYFINNINNLPETIKIFGIETRPPLAGLRIARAATERSLWPLQSASALDRAGQLHERRPNPVNGGGGCNRSLHATSADDGVAQIGICISKGSAYGLAQSSAARHDRHQPKPFIPAPDCATLPHRYARARHRAK